MIRVLAVGILLAVCAQPSDAAEAHWFGAGDGMVTCGHFAEQYRISPSVVEDSFYAWAEGFMTALNVAALNGKSAPLNEVPILQQKSTIREYCDAHPLATYMEAVISLYRSLPSESTEH